MMVAMFATIVPQHCVAAALEQQKHHVRQELQEIETYRSSDSECSAQGCGDWVADYGHAVLTEKLAFLENHSERLLTIAGSALENSIAEAAE